MRLVTFQPRPGDAHIGVIRGDKVIDLTLFFVRTSGSSGPEHLDMQRLIELGAKGLQVIRQALDTSDATLAAHSAVVTFEAEMLLAPIPRPRKNVLCMGRNYFEHAMESTRSFNEPPPEVPEYPIVFTKALTAVIGPNDAIPYDPAISTQIDWEGELAFIIGRAGKNIRRDNAMDYVFGYTIVNDISARDIQQRHGGQYFKGKSLDGTCPIGPWIVTPDELDDPGHLELIARVNGIEKQHGNTRDMMFDVPAIIEHLSLGMTLEPGDIVATGTPSGIGHARVPPEYLHPGDTVEVEIEKIGVLKNGVGTRD